MSSTTEIIKKFKEGTNLLHCEDGPAIVTSEGTQKWFIDGKLHRDNGPAIIENKALPSKGGSLMLKTESWFKNGRRHREGGPAVSFETPLIGEKWFGLVNKEVESLILKNLQSVKEFLYRCENDSKIEIYFNDGIITRDDGPAIKTTTLTAWFKNGRLHRAGGPAVIFKNSIDDTKIYIWFNNGMMYRDGENPSLMSPGRRLVWTNKKGKFHRLNDKPAVIERGYLSWNVKGLLHRDGDKPAEVSTINKRMCARWHKYGKRTRLEGKPASINAVLEGFETKIESITWCDNNLLHRLDGPARVYASSYNPLFSKLLIKDYYIKGRVIKQENYIDSLEQNDAAIYIQKILFSNPSDDYPHDHPDVCMAIEELLAITNETSSIVKDSFSKGKEDWDLLVASKLD